MKKFVIHSFLCLSMTLAFSCKTKKAAVSETKPKPAVSTPMPPSPPAPVMAAGEAAFPKVKAILAKSCVMCHNGYNLNLGTDLDIAKHAAEISDQVVSRKMPAKGTLTPEEVQIIAAWAKKGGKVTD